MSICKVSELIFRGCAKPSFGVYGIVTDGDVTLRSSFDHVWQFVRAVAHVWHCVACYDNYEASASFIFEDVSQCNGAACVHARCSSLCLWLVYRSVYLMYDIAALVMVVTARPHLPLRNMYVDEVFQCAFVFTALPLPSVQCIVEAVVVFYVFTLLPLTCWH